MHPHWPHQASGLEETFNAISFGEKDICLTSPTGGGKSRMMFDIIQYARSRDWRVVLYASRNMLIEQLIEVLNGYGLEFGVRAAEFKDYLNLDAPIQIASVKSEDSMVFKKKQRNLHYAQLVLWDEAHMQKTGVAVKIYHHHKEQGAISIGPTATPLEINHLYKKLIIAGKNSELRKCGAHLPCLVRAPDEPDLKNVDRTATGSFIIDQKRYTIWTQSIVGRVIDYYNELNPNRLPAILFAPGVKESMWFTDQLNAAGIRAAHIDGSDVYRDGKSVKSKKLRKSVITDLRIGLLDVVCNRFVLREGIDIPELYHGILATPFGSIKSYLQAVGRIIRNHESLDHVMLQDHGGSSLRHGSPNDDRDWNTLFHLSERVASSLRQDYMREGIIPEPIVCPKCTAVRNFGSECMNCGFKHSKSVRMVVQKDGKLVETNGRIAPPKRRLMRKNTERLWTECYYRCKRSGRTFKQAEGLFVYENHYYPEKGLRFMPKQPEDWYRKAKDVPTELLN